MKITDEELTRYQNDLRKARLLRILADRLKEQGILSPTEHRRFLEREEEKRSLPAGLLTR